MLCDGDSWTAGDLIDPELGMDFSHVNHPDNDSYRLPKVWPHKLGKLLNIEVSNISEAGSSNDGIVRRVLKRIPELLNTYEPKDLFVIIGWSSPERKDFWYNGPPVLDEKSSYFRKQEYVSYWETMYPAELEHGVLKFGKSPLADFYKLYFQYFWNEEEYMERYIQHNLLIHHFLNSYGVEHIFFDAFYQTKEMGIYSEMDENKLEQLEEIKNSNFINQTFREVLMDGKVLDKELFGEDFHPTEKGHEIWANELYKKLKGKL